MSSLARVCRRALALTERLFGLVLAALVVVLLLLVTGQLIDRHVVDVPIDAPDQYVRIAIIWLTFLGFALAIADRTAIRVDLIDHWITPRTQFWLGAACDLVMLAMAIVIVVKGWRVVEVGASQYLLGTPYTAALPNTGLFVGAVLMVLFLLARLVARFAPGDGQGEAR